MGATLSTESVLTAAVLVGAAGAGYYRYTNNAAGSVEPTISQQPKKKKKKGSETTTPAPVPLAATSSTSSTIPGQFDDPPPSSKPKKSKKKKTQPSTAGPSAAPQPPPNPIPPSKGSTRTLQQSTTSIDTDGSWTRVESRRNTGKGTIDVTATSDAGITSSLTEDSTPIDEESTDKRTTLAEKLVPKPPQTDVDDMLADSPPTLARVMRVRPLPNEKPPAGFSWDDYDNVQNDADGEDDGDWGVVKSRRPRTTKQEAQQPLVASAKTKKQRQNAKKREAEKAANAAAEAERVATLAKHKRDLERIRIIEQSRSSKKGKSSGV
ncbi:hypothetical protein NP233_g10262 [Leucocoprinus birnbaumii]|uniref:Uncharacterized protein n=1 Tax=Leucocoprinus birnbaumii TaxID=56174 RepID=A0AAD5VJ00_9AGAR|nr:hypothetical protein NP233_g10262 [Leucocoprinus birnbaumii]